MKKRLKSFCRIVGIAVILSFTTFFACNLITVKNAEGKLFNNIDSIPASEYGLLLGTTPQTRIGHRTNSFFTHRIDAAEQLYKARKIRRILISGDEHSLDGVNEVECMRDSLVARGVNADDILLDGKGFHTKEAVFRAMKVYGIQNYIIISQRFHNERAIYLAEHSGFGTPKVTGFNANDATSKTAKLTYLREYFARVKMFLDLLTLSITSEEKE